MTCKRVEIQFEGPDNQAKTELLYLFLTSLQTIGIGSLIPNCTVCVNRSLYRLDISWGLKAGQLRGYESINVLFDEHKSPDGGMADTADLKSVSHKASAGSSPAPGTMEFDNRYTIQERSITDELVITFSNTPGKGHRNKIYIIKRSVIELIRHGPAAIAAAAKYLKEKGEL